MVATLEQAQQVLASQQQQLSVLQHQVNSLVAALDAARATIARQQEQLTQYLQRLYGRRSERANPLQQWLPGLEPGVAQAPAEPEPADPEEQDAPVRAPRGRRRHPGRLEMPPHLERQIVVLEVPEEERVCPVTGKPMILIGYDDTERLEYRPASLFVRVYRRPKYASPDRTQAWRVGIMVAPLPDLPIPRGKAEPGLLAHAIVSKYADFLPLYRQEVILARQGVHIPRSTLDGWMLQLGDVLVPLGYALHRAALESDVVFTDDTLMPLLEKGRGCTRQARLWVYIRGGTGPPLVAYDFSPDRSQQRPLDYLGDYQGYVHADAYSGYDVLFRRPGVREVGCWAHARRRFFEALQTHPRAASEVVARIGQMYHVEEQLRPLQPQERHQRRLEEVQPLLAAIFAEVDRVAPQALPKDLLFSACGYVRNQRQALQTFLEDGRLEVDNNRAENAIRAVAMGRKNYLFVGSPRGGEIAALYLGLLASCKACQVNPWQYFEDLLWRIMSHPVTQLRQLLPDRWTPLPRDERGLVLPASAVVAA